MRVAERNNTPWRIRLLAFSCAVVFLTPGATAQTSPAAGRAALRQLEDEGEKFLAGELELPKAPDFAFRFGEEIDRGFILRQLYKVHHRREPVVDAYIRWQLLSYRPRLEELEEWEIEKLFTELPELVKNPCADPAVVERYEQMVTAIEEMAEQSEDRAQRYTYKVQEEWWRLRDERDKAELLNRPAHAFAMYWREHIKELGGVRGPHEPRLAWADFLNTFEAGWKVSAEKGRLTRALNERRGDETFIRRDRIKLKQRIAKYVGVEYRVLDGVDIPLRGVPDLTIGRRYVSEGDAKRWFEALDEMERAGEAAGAGDDAAPG
jgi:hypothetical protein